MLALAAFIMSSAEALHLACNILEIVSKWAFASFLGLGYLEMISKADS